MGIKKEHELKFFGIVWGFILSVFSILHYLKGHFVSHKVHLCIAFFVFIAALAKPEILKPAHFVLKGLWKGLVWITTRVLLIVFYYLVICPIGLIMRITGKDPLEKTIDKEAETYWISKEHKVATKESLTKQF